MSTRKGNQAENLVVEFLKKRNYKILARNFKVYFLGELDIIASKHNKIHCIEVKSSFRGNKILWLKINRRKFSHLKKTFEFWLKQNKFLDKEIEIDMALVEKSNNKIKISLYHNISL